MKKLIPSRINLIGLCMIAAIMACASVATAAIGLSGLGLTPSMTEYFTVTASGSVLIGTPNDPIEIYLDPAAGPWKKILMNDNNLGTLTFDEWLMVAADPKVIPPGPPWTDWDELILDPNWSWTGAPTVTLPSGTILTGTISTHQNPDDFVVFNFDPAQNPGTLLHVVKTLEWKGVTSGPPAIVNVLEWPTPEPGTIAMLISGAAALAIMFWRRRK
jgi:hypothetical protein